MKRLAILLTFMSTSALASTDPVKDARSLAAAALCGATNVSCQQSYASGAKDASAAFQRVLTAYKAIRAAETPPAPPPAPVPPPSPPPATGVELPLVPSNFDINAELVPTWGTGVIPATMAPDVVGAFRFICNAGQLSYDDPIVYPGQPGKSHLHQFFGNLTANASSTYASLRSAGNSSCMSPLNRSAYWIPAMLTQTGQVVRPDFVSIYYKRRPKTDPECTKYGGECVNLPRGLRYIFGRNMLDLASAPTGYGYFNCDGPGGVPGRYPSLTVAQANCPVTARIGGVISSPECWDGKNLDSADHRSHVSYMISPDGAMPRCPSTHPKVIAQFTLGVWYSQGAGEVYHLSSDEMPGMVMTPGTTFHADWFGAWESAVQAVWEANCIDKLLGCTGGDLGNGKMLRMFPGFSLTASPRLVAIPARP